MKKKHYVLVCKYPHQIHVMGDRVKKWWKPTRKVINYLGGPSYIDLGEIAFIKSLYVAFRVGMDMNKCFTVGKEDVQMMVLNQQ